jgi:hypothetical protein
MIRYLWHRLLGHEAGKPGQGWPWLYRCGTCGRNWRRR